MSIESWLWLYDALSVVVNKVSTASALELLFAGAGTAFMLNLLFMVVIIPFLRTLRQIVSSFLFLCMLAVVFSCMWWLRTNADGITELLKQTVKSRPSPIPPEPEEPPSLFEVVCHWVSSQWLFASHNAEL